VAKGIENDTLLTMTGIIEDELKNVSVRTVALSGPTHAEAVALDMPTTIVAACTDMTAAEQVQELFLGTCIRAYTNPDVLGVELSGAMKNIIALASGIATGLGCGDNTKAAIITRGIAEISRLGVAMGCSEQTFGGLAGIGDLIVTATSVPHLKALTGYLEDEVRTKLQRKPLSVDGEPASEWVLIDFGSVLVHVMSEEARNKYELERLWSDAPRLEIAAN
jgi:ribosome silencing factor RsfS/YbeB/iojap